MKKSLLILITLLSSFFAQAQIVKVNAAATGANNGASWADAYTDLQTALTNTSSDKQTAIIVSKLFFMFYN